MGDFFGGVLNPIFGLLTFLALLGTIAIQQKQLSATRNDLKLTTEELTLTRKEHAAAADALIEQKRIAEEQVRHLRAQAEKEDLYRIINRVYEDFQHELNEQESNGVVIAHPQSGLVKSHVRLRDVFGKSKNKQLYDQRLPPAGTEWNHQPVEEALHYFTSIAGELYIHLRKYEELAGNDDVSSFFKVRCADVITDLAGKEFLVPEVGEFFNRPPRYEAALSRPQHVKDSNEVPASAAEGSDSA